MKWIHELIGTNTSLVKLSSKSWAPLSASTFTSKFLKLTLEKIKTSPLHIPCLLMPQIIPLLTLMLFPIWYEEPPPMQGGFSHWRVKVCFLGEATLWNNKPCELNYMVHIIHWRRKSYKTWIYHSLQLMLETSLYVEEGIKQTLIIFFQVIKVEQYK